MASQKESLHGLQRENSVKLERVVFPTADVFPHHVLEKIEIPERSVLYSSIADDTFHIVGQFPLKPASVGQIFVEPGNSED